MFGFDMFGAVPRTFNTQFRCYSVVMFPGNEREDVERGGKIIMPPSALDQLTRLHIVYPMLFKLTNSRLGRNTHCGVLEFVADEGKIYLPYWVSCSVNIVSPTFCLVNNVFYRNSVFAQANINAPYFCSA